MAFDDLPMLDGAVRDSRLWLLRLSSKLPGNRLSEAYLAFQAVLHAIRDHVESDDAIRLGARLPTILRGIYYDGWNPSERRKGKPNDKHCLAAACHALRDCGFSDPESAVRSVVELLFEKADLRTLKGVERAIPIEIRGRQRSRDQDVEPSVADPYRLSDEAS